MAGSTATRTRRNVNFWPPWNRSTTKTLGSGRKPSRPEAGRRNHFATSCNGPLLRPSSPLGGGTAGQGPGILPAGHCPGAGNVQGRREEIPFGRKPSYQETQRQGASQGRGSGRIAIGRQPSRGDIFPFQSGGRNRWTTTQRQISVSRETPHRGGLWVQWFGAGQPLRVVDAAGCFPDPAFRLVDGLAEARVEAVAVQVALAGVVAADEAGPPDLRVQGLQQPQAGGAHGLQLFSGPLLWAPPWGR